MSQKVTKLKTSRDYEKESSKEIFETLSKTAPKSFVVLYRDDETEDGDLIVVHQTEDYVELMGMISYAQSVIVMGDFD